MLKKWFIEKCCFTDYCTVQLYKIVLKAWKQSALEHLQHPVLRQPSTWEGRVGEAFCVQGGAGSWEEVPAASGAQGSSSSIPWQRPWRLPPLESVSPGLGASISTKEELHFCAFSRLGGTLFWTLLPHWSLGNSSKAIYKASCSRCDRWIRRDRLWLGGEPFCFKCQILIAKEPMSALLHVHSVIHSALSQHFLINLKTIGFLKCCCLVSISLSARN